MDSSPYEAPRSDDLIPEDQRRAGDGSGNFSIGQCLSDAWAALTRNIAVILGTMLVTLLLSVVSIFSILGIILVIPVLYWGLITIGIKAIDGHAEFDAYWSGFRQYGKSLGRMLLLYIATIIIGIPGNIASNLELFTDSTGAILIGLAFSLLWSIMMLRLNFAAPLAVDADRPALDSLGASWRLTRGIMFLKVILLGIVTFLVGVSGVILLGIGLLFTIPLAMLMWASAYRQMVGRPNQPAYRS